MYIYIYIYISVIIYIYLSYSVIRCMYAKIFKFTLGKVSFWECLKCFLLTFSVRPLTQQTLKVISTLIQRRFANVDSSIKFNAEITLILG